MMTCISAILRPCDLKFGMYEDKTLLYTWHYVDYVLCNYFEFSEAFDAIIRVGSILSR
jgi:hypothetical protein